MATNVQQAQQIAQPIPGEKSSLPAMVLLAGWLIPGLGHLLLGRWVRALLLFVSIASMFAIGVALQGKVYSLGTGDILDILGFAAQLGTGLLCGLMHWLGWGASSALNTLADYGTKFLVCGGLLNYIAAVDAHSLANGRKAS